MTVAKLVAQGVSNPDIAARLFLSRRTVEAHVAHIFRKLQVRRRLDIAQIVLNQNANEPKRTINHPVRPPYLKKAGLVAARATDRRTTCPRRAVLITTRPEICPDVRALSPPI